MSDTSDDAKEITFDMPAWLREHAKFYPVPARRLCIIADALEAKGREIERLTDMIYSARHFLMQVQADRTSAASIRDTVLKIIGESDA